MHLPRIRINEYLTQVKTLMKISPEKYSIRNMVGMCPFIRNYVCRLQQHFNLASADCALFIVGI